ncbi:MEKHLA domain-containing protein [Chamaesiphon sp. OTE_75_metabat_556]|uniref:MEKHLA domain-containing protein n=1 Tax=Chamaesiphon sp. OTE_75_metabat_556 TaxID=2964692 RepID=UPI00286B9F45|nr:MEKHLA domain-containing protein [Chamaesiphon sp. OTE_75_metabat_556]
MLDAHVAPPLVSNDYDREHISIVLENLHRWTGRDLIQDYGFSLATMGAQVFDADFYLLSHNIDPDPILNYGNRRVLELWEISWAELTRMHSRETAKSSDRDSRSAVMQQVAAQNYVSGYSGVRVSKTGREFRILDVTIWNLFTRDGHPYGQAAWFKTYEPI